MQAFSVVALLLGLTLSGVSAGVNLRKNYQDEVIVREGESVELVCSADQEVGQCTWETADGRYRPFYPGAKYPRLSKVNREESGNRDCGVEVSPIAEEDNGVWKCRIFATDDNGESVEGNAEIVVVVAVPPQSVNLRVNGEQSNSETIVSKLDTEGSSAMEVDCVAAGARPEPSFKWYIGGEEIKGEVNDKDENVQQNGKRDYVQTLKYFPDPKHNGHDIKCVVEHTAYSEVAKNEKINEISRKLELYFKPQSKPKMQTFYGLKEGHAETVTIKFEANPPPTEGLWKIAGVESGVALGTESLDKNFKATHAQATQEVESEFKAALTINKISKEMAGKTNTLTIKNDEGETVYSFKLELGDKPPSEPLGSGPVIGVVVLILIILLIVGIAFYARSKGILCFSGKPQSDDKEQAVDKEGSDTESTEAKVTANGGEQNGNTPKDIEEGSGDDKDTTEDKPVKNGGARMSVGSIMAAVRKTVKGSATSNKKKDGESEPKDDDDKNKDGDDVTYANLDKSAMNGNQNNGSTVSIEDESRTEYAEIQPSKK